MLEHNRRRYFTLGGRELKPEEAKNQINFIEESLQYILFIKISSFDELKRVIDLFKRYASKYRLDNQGRQGLIAGNVQENQEAVYGAWEIPLFVCKIDGNVKQKNLSDFVLVNQFNILETSEQETLILSTLVKRKTGRFKRALESVGVKPEINKRYALRGSVENYIDK